MEKSTQNGQHKHTFLVKLLGFGLEENFLAYAKKRGVL